MPDVTGASSAGDGADEEADLPLFKRRSPRPFRPSSSRGDPLLAGIGFNVHVQSLSVNVLQEAGSPQSAGQGGVTQSVTHGAPADHARGFGGPADEDADDSAKSAAPRGGLRRLEGKRVEMAKELSDSVTGLIVRDIDMLLSRSCASPPHLIRLEPLLLSRRVP